MVSAFVSPGGNLDCEIITVLKAVHRKAHLNYLIIAEYGGLFGGHVQDAVWGPLLLVKLQWIDS